MPRGIPRSGKRVCRTNERRAIRPAVIDPNQAYDIPETAAALGQSIPKTWNDVGSGKLPSFTRGKRRFVLGAEIIRANRRDAGIEVSS